MEYGGFDVYKVYLGVKLHFTTASYDYIKYGGKVNAKLITFTKRKDRTISFLILLLTVRNG